MEEEIKKIKVIIQMYNSNWKWERSGFGNREFMKTKRDELRKDLEYFISKGVVIEDSLGFLYYSFRAHKQLVAEGNSQLINKTDERGI